MAQTTHKTRRRAKRFTATEREFVTTESNKFKTVADVLADELKQFDPDNDPDRVIWWGYTVVGVIRTGADGKTEVHQFLYP